MSRKKAILLYALLEALLLLAICMGFVAEVISMKMFILLLVLKVVEALLYRVFGKRGNPQTFHRAFASHAGFLHYPSLYQFTLLSGITAVDDTVSLLKQFLHYGKLFRYMLLVYQFDAEASRYHGQCAQRPVLPHLLVVVRFFQRAQVAIRPCHLVAVALHVSFSGGVGPEYFGYVACHAWFLSYTNGHFNS